jgi:hypothetical protein
LCEAGAVFVGSYRAEIADILGISHHAMSQINPFNWIAQAGQAPPSQSTAKQRQIRRAQNLAKNTALTGDHLEHEVESSDALQPAGDHDPNLPERRGKRRAGEERKASLDVKA